MMFIFEVPEGTDITTMDNEVQKAVLSVRGQWPEAIMPGTQPVGGKQIVLVYADAVRQQLESLIDAFSLDWLIVAEESEQVNQAALLPFYIDAPVFDEEGKQTGAQPVTDLTDKIQVFAGRNWIY